MGERIDKMLAAKAADALPDEVGKELRTRMRALPTMIQTSGLAATCAFLLSRRKNNNEQDPYHRTAVEIMQVAAKAAGIEPDRDPNVTLTRLSQASGHQYLVAETRASMLAMWLSRLAQARSTPERGSEEEAADGVTSSGSA